MQNEEGNIRIIDIARLAGVSVGTVDRVIHNRGKVSKENFEKVQAVLEQVNYQPNLIARSLASKKHFNIVAITPSFEAGQYWEAVSNGIDAAANEMKQYNAHIRKLFFDQYDSNSFDIAVENLFNEKIDGVLIATLFPESVVKLTKKLDEKAIPYVFVDSDIEGENRLAYFGTDSYAGGKIAAKLLSEKINPSSDILIAKIINKGKKESQQGTKRWQGFCDFLKTYGFKGNLYQTELSLDEDNFAILDDAFKTLPKTEGVVMFNSTCYIVGDYLKARNLSRIKLVGYDLIEKNTELLSEGYISALIAQRPESQGRNAIKSIFNYLVSKQMPEKINLMPIDILIKENIQYYP